LACNFELKQIGFVDFLIFLKATKIWLQNLKSTIELQKIMHMNDHLIWYGVVGGLSQNKESAKLSYKWSIWVLKF
jgi:hypothetical protein